jgi:MFS family permease
MKGTLAALRVRNFRLYFVGQAVSLVGTWMQSVALSWLVLELTHSGTMIGLVVAAQFLPVLLFGAYGGLLADRVEKRRLLQATQTTLGLLALLLGLLSVTHTVRLWMIFAIGATLGFASARRSPCAPARCCSRAAASERTPRIEAASTTARVLRWPTQARPSPRSHRRAKHQQVPTTCRSEPNVCASLPNQRRLGRDA